MSTETPGDIKAIECRFAFHQKSVNYDSDIHVVKEQIHYKDGTVKPNLRMIKNYQRPYWITKKGSQNHESKKEWEDLSKVNEFSSTQIDLQNNVAKSLGMPYFKGTLRDLQKSPFLYGTDISSTAILKNSYKVKWDIQTAYSNAAFDTETDVLHDTGKVKMATISFKDRVFTAIDKDFLTGYSDAEVRIKKLAELYIGDIIKERNIKIEIKICDSEIELIKACILKAHEWKPDFLSVWNIEFDMDKILDACQRAGVTPESFLCDPSIPEEYRSFKFKKGAAQKTTASGKVMVYKPAQRWHTVFCPASFYWIDAMCAYRHVRQGSAEEPSYALDAILTKTFKGKINKLKFKEADAYTGLKWHQVMQSEYPLEYVVYNQFDCISMEMQDEKIYDLSLSLPMFSGSSDFCNFNSQPKRTSDALYFFVQKHNKVFGTTSSDMTEDFDEETTSLDGWIIMLDAHLIEDNGLCLIEENNTLRTNIRAHCADLDIAGSYPNGEVVFNISKETTSRELIKIEGVEESVQRMQTINLSAGRTNAVEISCALYKLPTMSEMLNSFTRQI